MKRILYSKTSYSNDEIKSVNEVLIKQSTNLVNSNFCLKVEKKLCSIFGYKYACLVNSGSVANELAIQSLDLQEGSEVITPSLTFATTVAPLLKYKLKPVLVDVEIDTLNIDANLIEEKINKNTSAVMIPNLVGNFTNWKKIYYLAKKFKLKIIEDSADTIGGSHYRIKNFKSDILTSSFYGSHMVTFGGIGGVVLTNNKKLYQKQKLIREWGRRSSLLKNDKHPERFNFKINKKLPYDQMFVFDEIGSNYLLPEICAAFGYQQLKKINSFIKIRKSNFAYYLKKIIEMKEYFIIPKIKYSENVVWLSFPLILKKNDTSLRINLQKYLENDAIQTRPIFAGNIAYQPGFKKYFKNKKYTNSDHIMKNGILVGLHQSISKKDIDEIFESLKSFFNQK